MSEKRTTRGDNGTPGVHSKFDVRRRVDGPSIVPAVEEDRSARDAYIKVVDGLRGPDARKRLADAAREAIREKVRTAVPEAKYAHFAFASNDDNDLVFGLTSTATHAVLVRSGEPDPSVPASDDLVALVSDYASDLDREHVEADREFRSGRPDTYTLSLEKPPADTREAAVAVAAAEVELNACATRHIAAVIAREFDRAECVSFSLDRGRLVAESIVYTDSDNVQKAIAHNGLPPNTMLLHTLTQIARNVSSPHSDSNTLFWDRDDSDPSVFYLYVDGS